MNRNHKYILIDTDTCTSMDHPFVYNFAGSVIDQHGNVYEEGNFINADVFYGMSNLMKSAYYAEKIPQYHEQINAGKITVANWYSVKMWVREMCEKYDVKAIIAHNARFDYRSCTQTQRYETCSKYRYFFPYGVELWDTLRMARQTFGKDEAYKKFCLENGFVVQNDRPKLTAEVLYKYISGDVSFVEEHTGLADTLIEKEIFVQCVQMDPSIEKRCWA